MQLKQIMDKKIQRDQKNPTATSEEQGAKAGNCMPPEHSTTRAVGKPPKPPLHWTPGHTPLPSPNIRNQLASPKWE